MKTFATPNLMKFTAVSIALTVLFRIGLSQSIEHKIILPTIFVALVYAILMFFCGIYFGRRDHEYLPVYDVGFRFHFFSFLAHNLVSVLWFVLGFQSRYENIQVIYLIASIWSVILIIHVVLFLHLKKTAIKNLSKDELFE